MKNFAKLLFAVLLFISGAAYAADYTSEVLEALSGPWYDADGKYGFRIDAHDKTVAGTRVLEIKDPLDSGICTEAVWVFDLDGPDELRCAVDRVGETYLFSMAGFATYQNTEKIPYPDSIGGIYIGMAKWQVEGVLGKPDAEGEMTVTLEKKGGKKIESIGNPEAAVYKDKLLSVSYLYNRVYSITIEKGSPLTLDQTGLSPASPVKEIATAYNVLPDNPRYEVNKKNGSILPITEDEYIFIGKVKVKEGKKTVTKEVLTLAKWPG